MIWIATELYYPETTSTGYFLTKIAEGLAYRGENVSVVCSQPTYAKRGTRASKFEKRHGVQINRCCGTTLNKDIFICRIINLLTISFSMFFFSLLHFKKDDGILVVTNPPLLPFLILQNWGSDQGKLLQTKRLLSKITLQKHVGANF